MLLRGPSIKITTIIGCGMIYSFIMGSLAFTDIARADVQEKQMASINKSLKSLIEENRKLSSDNDNLRTQLQELKSTNNFDLAYEDLKRQHQEIAGRYKRMEKTNKRYTEKIKELEKEVEQLKTQSKTCAPQDYKKTYESYDALDSYQRDNSLTLASKIKTADETTEDITEREMETIELLTSIDTFIEDDDNLRLDAAKAHYNMGNIYFQKGKYEIAYREFYQAVNLMPDDPDSHYNLAFVSGEYLGDYQTALKHYKMYLYLNPNAKDAHLVREKIMEAELYIANVTNSPLENER